MVLNTDRGIRTRRNWRYLLALAALIAGFIWLLISNHAGDGSQPPHQTGNMKNTSQFQYPTGTDEEVLRTLAQKLAETVPQENHSIDQYLKPEDCHDYERFSKPMSETIKDFRERGSTITRIDAEVDTPTISSDGTANLNFRATLHFRNSRDGRDTNVARRYSASFKKENGRWQADRLEGMPGWKFRAPHPLMVGLVPPPFAGDDEYQDRSAAVSMVLRELTGAIQRRDASALEPILTEDYIGIVGLDFANDFNKARQIAMIETGGSSVEQSEFRDLRLYPSGAGETALIATFTGSSLFKISDADSSAKYRHYLRLDKQSERWTVSAVYINHMSGNPGSAEFIFTPEQKR
jgi:ketosteroid isomerase-like protein